MLKLGVLLGCLNVGYKHHTYRVSAPQTRINTEMLNLLLSIGAIEGFSLCPRRKYTYIINLPQYSIYSGGNSGYERYIINRTQFYRTSPGHIKLKVYHRLGSSNKITYRDLLRKHKRSNNRTRHVILTNKGLCLCSHAIRHKLGGRLICKVFF